MRRGVAVAAVAGGALAAGGAAAAALADADAGAPVLALAADRAAVAPVPGGAVVSPGGAAPLTVAVPVTAGPPEPAVLDPTGLSRAVARAQGKARELADEARDRTAEEGRAAAAARRAAAEQAAQAEEDRRTAERARRAGRAANPELDPAPAAAQRECGLDTGGLGAVRPHVRAAAESLGCAFGKPQVLGIAGRGGPSDHPKGLALDFMVDRATGDALAAYAVAHRAELGINYVIWRQRIDTGSGFTAMADRGNATANHFDHVHVSFRAKA